MVYKEVVKSFLKNYKIAPRIFINLFSIYKGGLTSQALPLRAQIENSTVCNLRCQMCPLSEMTRKKGFMSFAQFKEIYDQIKPPFLNLTGYGESFLNKDIFKMVAYAKKNGSYVKFDSNGTLLTETNIEKVFNSGLDLISFSVDGASKKTYEKIRIGGKFDNVTKGIKALTQERSKRKSSLAFHLAVVIQADNVNEFIEFIRLGQRLGVDKVNPTPVVEYDLPKNKKYLLANYREKLKNVVENYLKDKEKFSVAVDISPLIDFISRKNKTAGKVCFIPWYSTYVSREGDVYPCCYYYNGQIKLGNIFRNSFEEIWNGEKYQNFRKTLRDNRDSLPICRACSMDEKFIGNKISMIKKVPFANLLTERKKA